MSTCIQNKFVDDKRDQDGPIGCKPNFFWRLQMDFVGRDGQCQVFDDFAKICDQTNALVVGVIRKAFISACPINSRMQAGASFNLSLRSGLPTVLACK